MTTRLEYVCVVLSEGLDRGAIQPKTVARYLRKLIGTVGWIEPTENDQALAEVHAFLGKRYGRLLYTGKDK